MEKSCEAIQEQLVKLHLEQRSPEKDSFTTIHLETCQACRCYLEQLEQDHETLKRYTDSLDPCVERYKQKVAQSLEQLPVKSRPRSMATYSKIAAVVLLLVTLTVILMNRTKSPSGLSKESPTPPAPVPVAQSLEKELTIARQFSDIKDVSGLVRLLDSEFEPTQRMVAQYLGAIGDARALDALNALASQWQGDPNQNLYQTAIENIQASGVSPEENGFEPVMSETNAILPDLQSRGIKLEFQAIHKETGEPLSGVNVEFSGYAENNFATDALGRGVFQADQGEILWMSISAHKSGFVPMRFEPVDLKREKSPYSIRFVFEPAFIIGGVVQDPNGQPLEGVTVRFSIDGDRNSQEPFVHCRFKQETGQDGRWSCDSVPSEIKELAIDFVHPDCVRTYFCFADSLQRIREEEAIQALKQQDFVMPLERGLSYVCTLVDVDAVPIADAIIQWGNDLSISTDPNGQFVVGRFSPDETYTHLEIAAKGYPVTDVRLSFERDGTMGEVILMPGRTLSGTVVDRFNMPMAGAKVFVIEGLQNWVREKAVTDANGIYVLDSLPQYQIDYDIKKQGYMDYSGCLRENEELPVAILYEPIRVTCTASDAQTGDSLTRFKVTTRGISGVSQEDIDWHKYTRELWAVDGQAVCVFDSIEECYAVKIEAEGYGPVQSRLIYPGEPNLVMNFTLTKESPYTGIVRDLDGIPIADAQVFVTTYISELTILDGKPRNEHCVLTHTDKHGQFSIPLQLNTLSLVALNDYGLGVVTPEELTEHGEIILQPWAVVKGDLYIGSQPAEDHKLTLMARSTFEGTAGHECVTDTKTDASGRFSFERVPPGKILLNHHEYEVQPGQTLDLHLGGINRAIQGQLTLPGADPSIGWSRIVPWSKLVYEDPWEAPENYEQMSLEEVKNWCTNHGLITMISLLDAYTGHNVRPETSGHFSYDNLDAGRYVLVGRHRFTEKHNPQEQWAHVWHEFEIPAATDPALLDIPIDLGILSLTPDDLQVGDVAPNFDLPLIGGGRKRLNELTGVVLLSFYGSHAVKSAHLELETLQRLYQQFKDHDQFNLLAMFSNEEHPLIDAKRIDLLGLKWPHTLIGVSGHSKTTIDYNVYLWPSGLRNILVDTHGRIAGIGLKGEELIKAVETSLAHIETP